MTAAQPALFDVDVRQPQMPPVLSTQERVLYWLGWYFPEWRGRRMDRRTLAGVIGKPDRKVRDAVAELVIAGFPIVATSDERGYALVSDPDDLLASIRETASREAALRARREGLERAAAHLAARKAAA